MAYVCALLSKGDWGQANSACITGISSCGESHIPQRIYLGCWLCLAWLCDHKSSADPELKQRLQIFLKDLESKPTFWPGWQWPIAKAKVEKQLGDLEEEEQEIGSDLLKLLEKELTIVIFRQKYFISSTRLEFNGGEAGANGLQQGGGNLQGVPCCQRTDPERGC